MILTPWRPAGGRGGACVVPGTSPPLAPRPLPVFSTPIVAWPPTPLPRSWPVVPASVEPRVGIHDEASRLMTQFAALVTAHRSRWHSDLGDSSGRAVTAPGRDGGWLQRHRLRPTTSRSG